MTTSDRGAELREWGERLREAVERMDGQAGTVARLCLSGTPPRVIARSLRITEYRVRKLRQEALAEARRLIAAHPGNGKP